MTNLTRILLVTSMLALSACGSSHRPVYSGHEESTEGVPGFKNGKKVSPHVKLGQSYSVDGEMYVPRYEPGYTEEGMASWYGPGFHGGKTANGERFDTGALTAAHRTLPLPSMVKVTLLSTGKSVIVRVNDRGPFSKSRIIDLSKAAAEKIGLIGKGTGKVRVEYLGPETEQFTSLLENGRDPTDIDIDEEVLAPVMAMKSKSTPRSTWASRLNPISSAQAQEVSNETEDSADVMSVTASDLPPPAAAATPVQTVIKPAPAITTVVAAPAATSPFHAMEEGADIPSARSMTPMQAQEVANAAPAAQGMPHGTYLQLGAFANQGNAQGLSSKVAGLGKVSVEPRTMPDTSTLYIVRMGPYTDVEESSRVLAQLNDMGINPKTVTK